MRTNTYESVLVKPGKYYLGDPCYTVPNNLWHQLLDAANFFEPKVEAPEESFQGTIKGYTVYAFGTAYGDGAYTGTDGFTYPVDAGLIGLVPVEFGEPEAVGRKLVTVIEFTNHTRVNYRNGKMNFNYVTIDTDPPFEEEDDEYYEEDDYP